MKPKIEMYYVAKSSDPERKCGCCVNFQQLPGSDLEGRCFGQPVTAEGLCDFYKRKAS